jgi:hypothetical protein
MRKKRHATDQCGPKSRGEKTSLAVRGSLPRVFLTLGMVLEALLLFCRNYLLADAILQPLDVGTFSVVGGGSFLGFGTVLLFLPGMAGQAGIDVAPGEGREDSRGPLEAKFEVVQAERQPNWVSEKKEGLLRPM